MVTGLLVDAARRRRSIAKKLQDAGIDIWLVGKLHGAAQSSLRYSRGRGCGPGALTTAGVAGATLFHELDQLRCLSVRSTYFGSC
jgi:hypothetical protein